ncbi:MAG TPA: class I SAM-dependent methyltransferase, partial [Anaerolineae bacterium]
MKLLSAVSETAIITLKSRVLEAEKSNPVIKDDIGRKCLENLRARLPIDTRRRILDRKLPSSLTIYAALRARKYDTYARAFIEENPAGLVVSLGCGFDTRYWRVSGQAWNYVEIDLPDVIAAKEEVLGDMITYPMIGCSVLAESWVEEIQALQHEPILFLAEGLLMYLPKAAVIRLFNTLAERFTNASIVFEV